MREDVKRYLDFIESSQLFSLDKEKESNAYHREYRRMIKYLYLYKQAENRWKYEPYGCELTEIAIRCINNFDPEKGKFINYFNRACNLEFRHMKGDDAIESTYHGMGLSEKEQRLIKKYFYEEKRYEAKADLGISNEEKYKALAEIMNTSTDVIRKIAEAEYKTISGDKGINADNEEFHCWDHIDSGISVEREVDEAETIEEHLNKIEHNFSLLQERQKPIISDLMTRNLCEFLKEEDMKRYSFVSKEVLENWLTYRVLPTQRDIAEKYHRNEASISRSFSTFLDNLKKSSD